MTRLALLRHADTPWSVEGRIQGRRDVPLLEGVTVQIPETCRGMRIVTSPLLRCVQTAALLGVPDAPREPRIAEMDWGQWEGERLADLRGRLGDEMAQNEARGLDFTPPGGESPRMVLHRVRQWLLEVSVPTLAITHRGGEVAVPQPPIQGDSDSGKFHRPLFLESRWDESLPRCAR